MSTRYVHVITSECEVFVSREGDIARVRFQETSPDLMNPTSFELEGDPVHIEEALATAASVLSNWRETYKEPS